jgi:HlyD family secretion protein
MSDSMAVSKVRKRILMVLVIALVAAAAALLWRSLNRRPPENTIVLHGNVDIRQVDLAFNATERIGEIQVEEGDKVKDGQLLAILDRERLRHEVLQADAQARAQEKVVAALIAGTRPEEIRKARADVAAADAEARNAELTSRRLQLLAGRDLIAQQQADDAKAAADSARAQLHAAQETLKLAVAGPRKEDIDAAKATLQAFRENLAVARRNLSYASLYAPSDGVIRTRILEPGDMASPQKPVFTLALTDPVWVRAYVSESDLGKVRPGMPAEVTTDSFPGKRYVAWIGFISPSAQFTPKSVETREVRTSLVYEVRVFVRNPQCELRLGMPATVIIPLEQKKKNETSLPMRKKP